MTEAQISKQIQLAAHGSGCRLFRNTTGKLRDRQGRMVSFGLAVGSADLIGWVKCGTSATFLAVEVKSPTGRITKEQQHFIDAVNSAGGLGMVARSVEDFVSTVWQWRIQHGD